MGETNNLRKENENEHTHRRKTSEEEKEEAEAEVIIWKYVFGFTEMAVVKCAVELGIADELHKNGGSMSLFDLSSAIHCPPPSLFRIMRFLCHRKIFKTNHNHNHHHHTNVNTNENDEFKVMMSGISYSQTPLSRRLLTTKSANDDIDGSYSKSMAAFILLESSPVMLGPWLKLSDRVSGKRQSAFKAANGDKDVWGYAAENPSHSKLIEDAMACDARLAVSHIIKSCPSSLFKGVSSVVDVGGGDATTLSLLLSAFPWLSIGINFDLPHVVAQAHTSHHRLHHVGGDMFQIVPKADVAFLMWVLHDWGDDECVEILNKCKEAIAKDKGKVIIVEAVIADDDHDDKMIMNHHDHHHSNDKNKLHDVGLMLDMVMMAHTTHGKERTLKEWDHLLIKRAAFSHFNVYPLRTVQSVIEVFP